MSARTTRRRDEVPPLREEFIEAIRSVEKTVEQMRRDLEEMKRSMDEALKRLDEVVKQFQQVESVERGG